LIWRLNRRGYYGSRPLTTAHYSANYSDGWVRAPCAANAELLRGARFYALRLICGRTYAFARCCAARVLPHGCRAFHVSDSITVCLLLNRAALSFSIRPLPALRSTAFLALAYSTAAERVPPALNLRVWRRTSVARLQAVRMQRRTHSALLRADSVITTTFAAPAPFALSGQATL